MMKLHLTRNSYFKAFCVLAALVLLSVSSCEHPVGVFASLEEEIPVDEDRGVPTDDYMRTMLISADGEYYFAEFTSLYVRRRAEDFDLDGEPSRSWRRIPKPEAVGEHDTLGSIAEYANDNELWAIYGGELFSRPNDGGETGRGAWSEETAPGDISRASRLFSVGNELLLSARISSTRYELYRRNGSGWDRIGFDGVDDDRVNRINAIVEFDNHYYVATKSRIYRTDDLGINDFEPEDDDLPTAANFRELKVGESNGETALFAAGKKYVSVTTNGTDWTTSDSKSHDGEDVQFTALGWYVAENGNGYLIAGTEESGLYEAPEGDLDRLRRQGSGAELFGRDGNFLTTRLSGGSVHRIFIDEEGRSWRSQDKTHIFVGAPGRGLWRGEHDEEYEVLTWRRE